MFYAEACEIVWFLVGAGTFWAQGVASFIKMGTTKKEGCAK
jgi:hypothetical protein